MSDKEISVDEIASVLRDGAVKLIDYAKEKWMSDAYVRRGDPSDEAMRQENLQRWNKIRNRIPTKKQLVAMLSADSETKTK